MMKKVKIPRGRNGGRKPIGEFARIRVSATVLPVTYNYLISDGKSAYKSASKVLDEAVQQKLTGPGKQQ